MAGRGEASGWRLRAWLRSPGRPGVAELEDRRLFWRAIAAGRSSEDAAVDAGIPRPVGSRWFREAGGMPPTHPARGAPPPSGRYLSFAEREEIALLRAKGRGVREIARRIGRAASTVSRELRRNAATRSGGSEYRATTGAVACRTRVATPEGGEAGNERHSAPICGRSPFRPRHSSRRQADHNLAYDLEEAPPWPAPDAAVGTGLEPRAGLGEAEGRRPPGRDDAHQSRSHLPVPLRPGPWGAEARADRLPADGTGSARPSGTRPGASQVLRPAKGHDQRAACRSGGPGCARPLGGRSDPGPAPLSHPSPGRAMPSMVPRGGTLVERTARFTILLHLPPDEEKRAERAQAATGVRGAVMGHGAEAVRDAIAAAIATLPAQPRRSLTWE